MNIALLAVSSLLPLLYLGLLIDYGATFFLQSRTHGRTPALWGVAGFHALFIGVRMLGVVQPPLRGGAALLALLAFCTALVYLVLELATGERRTGAFVMVPVFLFQYAATMLDVASYGQTAAGSGWLGMHVLPAVVAFVALTVSAVYASLHLVLRRNLKRQAIGVFYDRLPPLDLLATMSWHALLLGFCFLTLSIVTGYFYFEPGQSLGAMLFGDLRLAVKVVAGSLAWLIYLSTVVGRLSGRWSSGRISRFSLTGFCAVMVVLGLSALFA